MPGSYFCPFEGCNQMTPSYLGLQYHIYTHTGEKPYGCPHKNCTFRSAQKGNLDSHVRRLHKNGSPPAKTRKKGGATKNPRKVVADQLRPWSASPAGAPVPTEPYGSKPNECPYERCSYRCAQFSNLGFHVRKVHESVWLSGSSDLDRKDSRKPRRAQSTWGVRNVEPLQASDRHLALPANHRRQRAKSTTIVTELSDTRGEKPYRCPYENCTYRFTRKGWLNVHVRRTHNNESPRESLCTARDGKNDPPKQQPLQSTSRTRTTEPPKIKEATVSHPESNCVPATSTAFEMVSSAPKGSQPAVLKVVKCNMKDLPKLSRDQPTSKARAVKRSTTQSLPKRGRPRLAYTVRTAKIPSTPKKRGVSVMKHPRDRFNSRTRTVDSTETGDDDAPRSAEHRRKSATGTVQPQGNALARAVSIVEGWFQPSKSVNAITRHSDAQASVYEGRDADKTCASTPRRHQSISGAKTVKQSEEDRNPAVRLPSKRPREKATAVRRLEVATRRQIAMKTIQRIERTS